MFKYKTANGRPDALEPKPEQPINGEPISTSAVNGVGIKDTNGANGTYDVKSVNGINGIQNGHANSHTNGHIDTRDTSNEVTKPSNDVG